VPNYKTINLTVVLQTFITIPVATCFNYSLTQAHKPSIYRVSDEEWTKLRESVPYVELYQYNPKHLYPKLNGYGDNGQISLKL